MAGASMNDIKARIKSVTSTMQITKAMELVATSKLRRAKEKAERSRPFHKILGEAISEIEGLADIGEGIWSRATAGERTLFIVIAGDRGLAGGYNSNVFRLTRTLAEDTEALFLPIGKKALEHYRHRGAPIYSEGPEYVSDVSVGDALAIAESICEGYKSGEFDRAVVVYTRFVSMLTQMPVYEQLLPLERSEAQKDGSHTTDPLFGGDPEVILDKIVPEYVGGILNSAICEALASESGARRTAMNAANKNAGEMIDTLMLSYNRARQAAITQEITEIVSGAEAL